MGTNFTVSIEAASGVTTGISAADRARTVQAAVKKDARPEDIVQPGHIFPLMAQKGGVLVRAGHTEAGCDLAQLAGPDAGRGDLRDPEGRRRDGAAARPDRVRRAAQAQDRHHRRSDPVSQPHRIAGRARRRARSRDRARRVSPGRLPRQEFARHAPRAGAREASRAERETLVRVHEPLSVVDLLDAGSRSHSWNLNDALRAIAAADSGVVVLLHRTETGAELLDRLDMAEDAMAQKVDLRTYGIGAQILRDLGVTRMRLLAAPRKMPSMAGFDLEVTGYLQPQAGEKQD